MKTFPSDQKIIGFSLIDEKVTFTLVQNKLLDLNDLFLSIYICFLRKSGSLTSPQERQYETKC